MAFEGGGSFGGAIAGVIGSIASFVKGFFGFSAKQLLQLVTYLKDRIVDLSQALLNGVVQLGKSLAKALVSFARLAGSAVKRLALWADRKFRVLEQFLKDKFGPVLRFIKNIKDHLDEFYKRYVRPIIDTIEFIRQLNRVLQVFHIDLLRKLDATLARLEQKIEDPFLWARERLTLIENWIDRIVTLDGLFQRLTLLRSLDKYAPSWIASFWARQVQPGAGAGGGTGGGGEYPNHEPLEDVNALADYWRDGSGDHAGILNELRLQAMQVARTRADR